MKLVKHTERLKSRYELNYQVILPALPVSASTYRRWRLRIRQGQDPIRKPGPKPLQPLNLEKLNEKLQGLVHGKKRSRGTGKLHIAMKDFISRRELSELIARFRNDYLRDKRAAQSVLQWHVPGTVWSMDIFEIVLPAMPRKCFVLSITDLASGYKLEPMVIDRDPHGWEVAAHLKQLFRHYGAPLFIKRDNGSNLNASDSADLLAEAMVLPLNSPSYYAPYNGAIEHAQGEIKWKLKQEHVSVCSIEECARSALLVIHDLNHLPRRGLGGDTSCRRFFAGAEIIYTKRKRKEVFLWISERALDIVEEAAEKITPASAWRIACQIWLVKNGLLTISKQKEVLPYFLEKTAHN